MYMKELPFEDKVDLFSPLCSKYQWEYACNNTQRITLSASRCNKMHTWFWLSFFFSFFLWFSRRVLKWQCILYMRMNSHSHMLQMFFQILSLCDVNHFHLGWCAMLKEFNVQMVRVECTCHPSPYLRNTTGKFVSCWSWMVK